MSILFLKKPVHKQGHAILEPADVDGIINLRGVYVPPIFGTDA